MYGKPSLHEAHALRSALLAGLCAAGRVTLTAALVAAVAANAAAIDPTPPDPHRPAVASLNPTPPDPHRPVVAFINPAPPNPH